MSESRDKKRLLIIKPSSLGDIVHTLPVLSQIYRSGEFYIDWLVASGFDGLLRGHPMLNRLWVVSKDRWRGPMGVIRFFRDVILLKMSFRREAYDVVLDIQGLFRSGILTFVSGAPLRVGFSDAREGSPLFYNRSTAGGKTHAVERYLKLLPLIGIVPGGVEFPLPHLPPTPVRTPYYVVAPGARWKTKIWPTGHFSETIGLLKHMLPSLTPVIVGGASDTELAKEISEMSGVECIDLTGRTDLKTLASVLKGARFMLTNDSGPMHLAAAMDTPVFAIFGPTSEELTGPYGQIQNVLKTDLPCRPCFKRTCEHTSCMNGVRPEEVINKIKDSISIFNHSPID